MGVFEVTPEILAEKGLIYAMASAIIGMTYVVARIYFENTKLHEDKVTILQAQIDRMSNLYEGLLKENIQIQTKILDKLKKDG
jgi:hypothetical protein